MSAAPGRVLLTGGSGRLGSELRALLPAIAAPTRAELDVTDPSSIRAALARWRPEVIVHAAAYTDVAAAERERERCWAVNVGGTRNMVRAANACGARLLHVSTDYVFDGRRGMYREDEPPGPACNYYGLSKLVSEELARMADRHLVVRTSFRTRGWPHPDAFTDLYTSQDYVDVIAPDIALIIRALALVPFHTLHVATERKSAYELARRRRPDVRPGVKREAAVALADDTSLDVSRWLALRSRLAAALPQ